MTEKVSVPIGAAGCHCASTDTFCAQYQGDLICRIYGGLKAHWSGQPLRAEMCADQFDLPIDQRCRYQTQLTIRGF